MGDKQLFILFTTKYFPTLCTSVPVTQFTTASGCAGFQSTIFKTSISSQVLTVAALIGAQDAQGGALCHLLTAIVVQGIPGGVNAGGAADAAAVHSIAGDFVLLDPVAARGRRAFRALA